MENQTKNKYLKHITYAIGEILLVVIGILIAVQMNNWNTSQNNKRNADKYLQNISEELKSDTMVFNQVISQLEELIPIKRMVLNNSQIDSLSIEYLDATINTRYFNIKINDAIFLGMKDNNVLNLSNYETLFQHINYYYTFYQDYLNNFSEWEVSLATRESIFWEEQEDFEISLLNYSEEPIEIYQNTTERRLILISKINSIKGRNYLKLNLHRLISVKNKYISCRKFAIKLMKEIDEHK